MTQDQPTADRFMDFSEALKALKEGRMIRRPSWNCCYLKIMHGNIVWFYPNFTRKYRKYNPAPLSEEEIMADDWEVVPDE